MPNNNRPWWQLSEQGVKVARIIVYTAATVVGILLLRDSGIPFVYRIPLGALLGISLALGIEGFLGFGLPY